MATFNEIQVGDQIRIDNKGAILGGFDLTNGKTYKVIEKCVENRAHYTYISILDDAGDVLSILESELHAVTKVA